jgi:hypothetical protein
MKTDQELAIDDLQDAGGMFTIRLRDCSLGIDSDWKLCRVGHEVPTLRERSGGEKRLQPTRAATLAVPGVRQDLW